VTRSPSLLHCHSTYLAIRSASCSLPASNLNRFKASSLTRGGMTHCRHPTSLLLQAAIEPVCGALKLFSLGALIRERYQAGGYAYRRVREASRVGRTTLAGREGTRVLDSSWTPETGLGDPGLCKSMRNLVGLPGFEPGSSCTPNSLG
jgi:hypothetical protein